MKKSFFIGIINMVLIMCFIASFLSCTSSPLYKAVQKKQNIPGVGIVEYRTMLVCVGEQGQEYLISCVPVQGNMSEDFIVSVPGLKDRFYYLFTITKTNKLSINFTIDSVNYSIDCNKPIKTNILTVITNCSTLSIDGNEISQKGLIKLKEHLDPLDKEERAVLNAILNSGN